MSYNQGWNQEQAHQTYGQAGTLMAFDIAALQALYGANMSTATGPDTYQLPATLGPGTYWESIWDAGGFDTISNSGSAQACTIDLRAAPLTGANAAGYVSYIPGIPGGFTIANGVVIEDAHGGLANDVLIGNAANNNLFGDDGNDIMSGDAGIDFLIGGDGNDIMSGGEGNDVLFGGDGNDIMSGGAGNDNFFYGGAGADTMSGDAGIDFLIGDDGNDIMSGGEGNDLLHGGDGNDTMSGDAGNDFFHGGDGNDTVSGGAGNDELWGAGGGDTLTGGRGADYFWYGDTGETGVGVGLRDVITDFKAAQGDTIILLYLDAVVGTADHEAFIYIGAAAFSAAGQLRFENGILSGETTGDGVADFEIHLSGVRNFDGTGLNL